MTAETEKKPMGFAELVRRVGDHNIRLEFIESNIVGARLIKDKHQRGLTEIKLVTSMTNPNQVMAMTEGKGLPQLGILIWFPRELWDQARMAHDADASEPSAADKLAAAMTRCDKLENLLQTLLLDTLDIGRERGAAHSYVRCRHCHAGQVQAGAPVPHRDGCVAKQVRDLLSAGL